MAGELVFITGGSGMIGYRVIVEALSAGYKVRAAVRSQAKTEKILAAPSVKSLNNGSNIEFVVVPDIVADGAYDNALNGASYIIHVASPLPNGYKAGDSMDDYFITPAVKATLSILEAAKKSPAVKRVVITSSIVAVLFPLAL
jgi:nucleoside-diphosphate-sugar epimerase